MRQHSLNAAPTFLVFTLMAVITTVEHYERKLGTEWTKWKATNLGDPSYPVHEPEVRGRSGKFEGETGSAIRRIPLLGDFALASCTIHRTELTAQMDPAFG